MNLVGRLFSSSVGRKFLMAVTGVILIGFVIGHLVGNLQIFQHPDHINGYGAFLHGLGPLLWGARLFLLATAAVHIWAATVLTLENRAARGTAYGVAHTIRATLSSRFMRWTGVVVLAFLLYHLAHFTIGSAQSATFKENLPHYTMTEDYKVAGFPVVHAGAEVLDVYSMVVRGFQHPLVSLFYLVAVGLLSIHLLHGFDSMFQSLGWRSEKWANGLRRVAIAFCIVYFLANAAIPGAILLGKVHAPVAAVQAVSTH
ncbi:MAG TPA: succinate dehydrogenase cytochrome b subunit [Opitutaceae bacterium]|nr:succinate dehydrogenase cytochrome b subunit [Opitutaceae bacterium]HND60366.1 succinate dehydrogenase cytochrome b subunit [Opitutaceae bacterium]